MKKSTVRSIRNLVPAILAATTVAPAAPPVAPPTAPARPVVVHLAAVRPAVSPIAPEPPKYAGQWMDANHIAHTPMYVPEPIAGVAVLTSAK